MTQTARPPETRGNFTQFPVILTDKYSSLMSGSDFVAFLRFYRLYEYKGRFVGPIRKLATALDMPRSTLHRAINKWVEVGLIEKERRAESQGDREEMTLILRSAALWQENKAYCKTLHSCPRLGQEEEKFVPSWESKSQNIPALSQNDTTLSQVGTKTPHDTASQHSSQGPLDQLDQKDKEEESLLREAQRGSDISPSSLSQPSPDVIPIATSDYTPVVAAGLYESPAGEVAAPCLKGDTVLAGGIAEAASFSVTDSLSPVGDGGLSLSSSLTQEEDKTKIPWHFTPMKECPPVTAARRRSWQDFYNARRGNEPLTAKGPRVQEAVDIGFLVDHYTDAQVAAIDDFVTHKIYPYKLSERRGLTSATIIRQQAQNARDRLKDAHEWPPPEMSRQEWDHRVRALPQLTRVPREDVPEWFITALATAAGGK